LKLDLINKLVFYYLKIFSKKQHNSIDIDNVKNICILSNTAIGDTLFSTPAIRLLRQKYPQKKIITVLNPKNSELFINNTNIDLIYTYNSKWSHFFSIVKKLRREKIDLTFIFHSNEPQATPLAFFIKSKYIVKIPNINNKFNFLHTNNVSSKNPGEHFIDYRLRQLELIGIFKKNYKMDLFIEESEAVKVSKKIDLSGRYIGFQVGASSPSRLWNNKSWVLLAKKILDYNPSLKIIITGSSRDKELSNQIIEKINSERVIDTCGWFDLCSSSYLISKLEALITLDTGPLHIAASLNIPTVCLSVAGKKNESNPRSSSVNHLFIEKPETCNPCIDKKCKNAFCMNQITVEEVFSKYLKL